MKDFYNSKSDPADHCILALGSKSLYIPSKLIVFKTERSLVANLTLRILVDISHKAVIIQKSFSTLENPLFVR